MIIDPAHVPWAGSTSQQMLSLIQSKEVAALSKSRCNPASSRWFQNQKSPDMVAADGYDYNSERTSARNNQRNSKIRDGNRHRIR